MTPADSTFADAGIIDGASRVVAKEDDLTTYVDYAGV
jgi:hypothetical protein